jgi:hypothetical protein
VSSSSSSDFSCSSPSAPPSFAWSGAHQSAFESATSAIRAGELPTFPSKPQNSSSSKNKNSGDLTAATGEAKKKDNQEATSSCVVGLLVGEFQHNVTRGEFASSPWHRTLNAQVYDVEEVLFATKEEEEEEEEEEESADESGSGRCGGVGEKAAGSQESVEGGAAPVLVAKDLLLVLVEEPPLKRLDVVNHQLGLLSLDKADANPAPPSPPQPPPPPSPEADAAAVAAAAALPPANTNDNANDANANDDNAAFGRRLAMLLPSQEVVTLSRVHLPSPQSLDPSRPSNWLHPANALARAEALAGAFLEARALKTTNITSSSSSESMASSSALSASSSSSSSPLSSSSLTTTGSSNSSGAQQQKVVQLMTYVLCAQATRRVVAACVEVPWDADPQQCLDICAAQGHTPAVAFALGQQQEHEGGSMSIGGGDGGSAEAAGGNKAGLGYHSHHHYLGEPSPPMLGPFLPGGNSSSFSPAAAAAASFEVVVDEEKVAMLVETMGFPESLARDALRNSRNDIDAAANTLFGGGAW